MAESLATDPSIAAVLDVVAGRAPSLDEVDPERFIDLVSSHAIAGLAVSDARRRAPGDGSVLPDQIARRLTPAYHGTALQSTLVLESADRAVAALEHAGIRALLFKGAALLTSGTYGDPGGRALEDADILVRPDDASDAVGVLTANGFIPWTPWDPSRMGWLSSLTLADRRAPQGLSSALDLHWATPYGRLRQAGPWQPHPLWERALGHVPAPEAHFVLIAEHFLKHLRVSVHLRGAADMARLAPLLRDADFMLAQARARRSLPGLRNVLAFLRTVLRIDVRDAVLSRLGVPPELPRGVRARLDAARIVARETPPSRIAGVIQDWMLIGSPLRSVWELVRVGVPPERWLRDRYPEESALRRRVRYAGEIRRWALGSGPSPLLPNQEL